MVSLEKMGKLTAMGKPKSCFRERLLAFFSNWVHPVPGTILVTSTSGVVIKVLPFLYILACAPAMF